VTSGTLLQTLLGVCEPVGTAVHDEALMALTAYARAVGVDVVPPATATRILDALAGTALSGCSLLAILPLPQTATTFLPLVDVSAFIPVLELQQLSQLPRSLGTSFHRLNHRAVPAGRRPRISHWPPIVHEPTCQGPPDGSRYCAQV
jgi:hypothetical protein